MEPHQFNFNIEFIIIMNYILKIFFLILFNVTSKFEDEHDHNKS